MAEYVNLDELVIVDMFNEDAEEYETYSMTVRDLLRSCAQNGVTVFHEAPESSNHEKAASGGEDLHEINVFDGEEIHENCTVQILTNSMTGKISIGWWENG